jgi:hypothetical protein
VQSQQFLEGEKRLSEYWRITRNSKLVSDFKKGLRSLACSACGFDFEQFYGEIGKGFIEAHHRETISSRKSSTPTTVQELDAVCPNCHRMLHQNDPPFTVAELKDRISRQRPKTRPEAMRVHRTAFANLSEYHPGIATVFPVPLAGFAECVNLLVVNMPDFDRVPLPQPNVLSFRTISGMPTPSAIVLGSLFPISPEPKRVCGSERLQLKAGFMRVSPSQNPQFAAIYWNKISPTIGPTEICEAYFDPWNCNLKQKAGPTTRQTVPL